MSAELIDNRGVGRLGELLVEKQLLERGWHTVRLDTGQMLASNAESSGHQGKVSHLPAGEDDECKVRARLFSFVELRLCD